MAIISVSKKEDLGSCFPFFRGPQIGKRTSEYSIYVFKGLTNGWKTTKSISAQTEEKNFFFYFLADRDHPKVVEAMSSLLVEIL